MDSCEEMSRYMDPVLYNAAGAGDIGRFENDQTCLDQLLTPDGSTILHVYLRNQRREPGSTDFVAKILEMCPALLLKANKKGETPLHLAAKYGHSNVVKVLIERAKPPHADPESGVTAANMMRTTNGEGDTALHEAARNKRSHVVEILTKEDPDLSYSANVHGETPFYIAASIGRRRDEVIDEILSNCISVHYDGPHGRTASTARGLQPDTERNKVIDEILRNCSLVDYDGPNGRTALHAAITTADYVITRKILAKEEKLTKTTDENGWTPLHYAAYFSDVSSAEALLECDVSSAYVVEKEKKRTALHIAAIQGNVVIMEVIVSRCPACCDLVDNRGWNTLHYAVASQWSYAFKECLRRIPELERLKTEKDDKGNTPFHLIAALTHKEEVWRKIYCDEETRIYGLNKKKLSTANIYGGDYGEDFSETANIYGGDYRGDFGEIQKEIIESLKDVGSGPFGFGPFLFPHRRNENREEEIKQRMKNREEAFNKARESHLVVAALIATVTFAAAFTLPGGYKSDQGTAILAKRAAFIVFLISDAISMVLSISAIFIHFLLAFYQGSIMETTEADDTTVNLFELATLLTMIGMGTMIIAFITGTYAVLELVLGLAISICLIGLSFFLLACGIIYKDFGHYIYWWNHYF